MLLHSVQSCELCVMLDCQNIVILGDIKVISLIALKCRHDVVGVEEPFNA